jgi:hypoxanthine phosphoribosyltransferase
MADEQGTASDPGPRTLISEERIARRVDELAAEISRDYAGKGEILLVGVLRGCFVFLADLSRRLTVPRRVDFIAVQSYQGAESGAVRMLMDVHGDVQGRHVLIVEDIIDSGQTLAYLLETFQARRPASLKTCVFVRKEGRRNLDVRVDYLGLEIPDVWVVGYGLDYDDHFRTLPYIGELDVSS